MTRLSLEAAVEVSRLAARTLSNEQASGTAEESRNQLGSQGLLGFLHAGQLETQEAAVGRWRAREGAHPCACMGYSPFGAAVCVSLHLAGV